MDATRLRALIDGALSAQAAYLACKAAEEEIRKERERITERVRSEVGNLRAAIADGAVIYGDKLVSVRPGVTAETNLWVYATPLVNVPVVAPPPAPLPETEPPTPKANPLSGGKIPEVKKPAR